MLILSAEVRMFWGTFNVKVHFVMVQTIIKISTVKESDTMIN